jgi:hypothetical protein
MITLPSSRSRIWLVSFWSALCIVMGLVAGALLWLLMSPLWSTLAIIATSALIAAGALRPQTLSGFYKLWNAVARKFGYAARLWTLGICFFIVFFAVGRAGASLSLERPDSRTASLWQPRNTLAPSSYICQHLDRGQGLTQRSWISAFSSWAAKSGNLWACCVLPLLVLVKALETEEESSFPSNIYTLY